MAFRPFGKDVGPAMKSTPAPFTPFGASAPTHPTGGSPIQQPVSQNHSAYAGQSFGSGGIQSGSLNPPSSIRQPYQPGGIHRSPEPDNRVPWASEAFSRPSPSVRPYQFPGVQRPTLNPQVGRDGSGMKNHGDHGLTASAASVSHTLYRIGTDSVEIGRSQDSKRKSQRDLPDQGLGFSRRNQSHVSGFQNDSIVDDFQPSSSQTWMRSSSSIENNPARSKSNPNRFIRQGQSPNSSFPNSHEAVEIQEATRTKSLVVTPSDKPLEDSPIFTQDDSRRFSASPPASGSRSFILSRSSDSQLLGQPSFVNNFNHASKTSILPASKRPRSPPLYPVEEAIQGNSSPSQDYIEGEEQAKAKRLARFKGELEPIASRPVDTQLTKSSVNKTTKALDYKQTFNSVASNRDAAKGNVLSDYESSEEPSLIIGLCPDMCPESERGERERKGDLDQYERVDGDRNQTSKSLAVKKYTRTAEQEAILIRPMPILQNTMDYLLSLLDQPYDENFLGMYNFLWDRMRAIRMDLRMQHIFNEEAITLLEQMIRLHIIAMHELCEYTKGEGFSEGFDAHLNIEQMNKTSVELFQMYDDHRKKGITIPTEKEFRGYYALLKLDKHPGYKVEPSELSLDLANMTPEIRQTSEVLFARSVARACRTGNFIAFFRLARKASYLQACLMHAHFSKLRTQALASLHSGLQNNQGLPMSDTSKWIGMEEEDVEALLKYYGFSIKEFEEPYMVKDGLFLHADKDYPTKCSKLVHMKKSRTIVEDVSAPSIVEDILAPSPLPSLLTESTKDYQPRITAHKQDMLPARSLNKQTSMRVVNEEMTDLKTPLLPEEGKPTGTSFTNPVVDQQKQNASRPAGGFHSTLKFYTPVSLGFPQPHSSNLEKQPIDSNIGMFPAENRFSFPGAIQTNFVPGPALAQTSKSMPMDIVPVTTISEPSTCIENEYASENSDPEAGMISSLEKDSNDIDQEDVNANGVITDQYEEEVANAKLKLIIRLWKRWSSRQSEWREHRQLAATAALSSLSLGPPIRFYKTDQTRACGELNIDQAMRRRFEEREQSFSKLNISDMIADILVGRDPDSKCICWKLILCTQIKLVNTTSSECQAKHSAASRWLSSKLMPHAQHSLSKGDLLFSAPGLSIWNKLVASTSGSDLTCCLSVARDVEADNNLCETTRGASAVLFLASEGLALNFQREQLNSILESIPRGSALPLLIVISSCDGEGMDRDTDIVAGLGLHDIDKSKIASFTIVSIVNTAQRRQGAHFFSDTQLRDGLKWLASNSPLQPKLHLVKPRELVLIHFSFSLEVLKKIPDREVGPNTCISAFNNALETSQRNIISAAEANPTGWPCPEIMLLEDEKKERLMVKRYLPNLDWSTVENIEPLTLALENCMLPYFDDDMTWLTVGCAPGAEIESLTQRLERCLAEYLTQTSNLMGVSLATKETAVMLQRNTRLELHNSSYHIIPRWIGIFQRIFNWRLMGLLNSSSSSSYVLNSDLSKSTSSLADKLLTEDELYPCSPPSLHEMIQVSCSPLKSPPSGHVAQSAVESVQTTTENREATERLRDIDESSLENSKEACTRNDLMITEEDELADETDISWNMYKAKESAQKALKQKETERLDDLLEKCNLLQNTIAEKLCIYF